MPKVRVSRWPDLVKYVGISGFLGRHCNASSVVCLIALHMHHYTKKHGKIVLFWYVIPHFIWHCDAPNCSFKMLNAKQFPAIISFGRGMSFCGSLILMRESKKPAFDCNLTNISEDIDG